MRFVIPYFILTVFISGCGSKVSGTLDQAGPPTQHARTTVQWGLVGVSDVATLDHPPSRLESGPEKSVWGAPHA